MPGDYYLFALLDQVKQMAELVLRLKGADLAQSISNASGTSQSSDRGAPTLKERKILGSANLIFESVPVPVEIGAAAGAIGETYGARFLLAMSLSPSNVC
jgi:hypothetical protein